MEDLYAVLGVPPNATSETIRSAYLGRIRRAHPDAGGDEEEAKRLTAAYSVLSDPHRRAEYDRSRQAGTCLFCGQNLFQMSDIEGHLARHFADAMELGCRICGRLPADEFTFSANAGFLIFRQVYRFEGRLCQVCAQGVYREFQARNITRGPWGIISFFAAIWYLLSNYAAINGKTLGTPIPQDTLLDTNLRGKPVFSRPAVWLSLSIIAILIFGAVSDAIGSSYSSRSVPVSVTVGVSQPANDLLDTTSDSTIPTTTRRVTSTTMVRQPLGWVPGGCVRVVSSDSVIPVACDAIPVDFWITSIVPDPVSCPSQVEYYVELDRGYACLAER